MPQHLEDFVPSALRVTTEPSLMALISTDSHVSVNLKDRAEKVGAAVSVLFSFFNWNF